MKWIYYNTGAIAFLLLAAFMVYQKAAGYGWPIAIAACLIIVPKSDD